MTPSPATPGKPRINPHTNVTELCIAGRVIQVFGTTDPEEAQRIAMEKVRDQEG